MSVVLLVIGIVLFIGLIVVHEFGHFIAARRNGVKVEEFGIFFPPRLFKKKMKGGWDFTINLLPLGGFVRLHGEHDSDTEKGSFGAASLWAKTQIMAAGVAMNLLIALLLLTFLALVGMPKLLDNQFTVASDTKISKQQLYVGFVEKDSPAAKAGLKAQDKLLAYRGAPCGSASCVNTAFTTTQALKNATKTHAGSAFTIKYERGGKVHVATVQLRSQKAVVASQKTNDPKGYLGMAPNEITLQRSTWSAPVVAVGLSTQMTKLTFEGLGKAVGGLGSIIAGTATGNSQARVHGQTSASEQVSGPYGIFLVLQIGSSFGLQYILFIIAIISLTLAIMNILPIPALDGGKLWITLVARGIFKKPLKPKTEELVNAIGFIVLITLMIVITVVDVRRNG
ncbi:MAG: hypothetical protein JWM81_200 [Candidatus Saccharibacteria bacterium]|nr:hypothetical protein [Candidatus Saccharibacteria bacterium]